MAERLHSPHLAQHSVEDFKGAGPVPRGIKRQKAMGIGGDDAHLRAIARQHGGKARGAAFIRTMGKGEEDVVRERRAHDLLVMPPRIADVEIGQCSLLGKLGAQVGNDVVIRGVHLSRLEMFERDHRRRNGKWSGRDRDRRDSGKSGVCWGRRNAGKEILIGWLRGLRWSREDGKTGEQQKPELGGDSRHRIFTLPCSPRGFAYCSPWLSLA